jgi:hypothetical protein
MMTNKMATMLTGLALVVLGASPASGQTTEIGGGYAIQRWDTCCQYGFAADVAQAVKSSPTWSVAVVGDFGWARMSGVETDTSYAGGMRVKFLRDRRVALFAQGTAGLMRSSIDAVSIYPAQIYNDFIMGGGGGAQVRLTARIDLKAQMDVWADYYADAKEWHRVTRFVLGAVVKFGK